MTGVLQLDPMFRKSLILAGLVMLCGCTAWRGGTLATSQPITNPLFVSTNNDELVWERAVEVLHRYHFEIARENRLARTIETQPLVGASLVEPWHSDAVTVLDRLEGTTQSIRRIAHLSLQPGDQRAGYTVSVAVYKEKEDVQGLAANSAGAATFQESSPLQRDLDPVVGQSGTSTWIPLGRDLGLEQEILQSLYTAYAR